MVTLERLDFLRHIVNPLLAKYSRERKGLVNVVNEVRKLIALAEDKYGFSSFEGNPGNLAKYLRSTDFDLVIGVLKSANAMDLVKEILKKVIENYRDLAEVVAAARERIESIEKGVEASHKKDTISQDIISILADAKITERNNGIAIDYKGVKAYLTKKPQGYGLDIRAYIEIPLEEKNVITKILRKLAETIEEFKKGR